MIKNIIISFSILFLFSVFLKLQFAQANDNFEILVNTNVNKNKLKDILNNVTQQYGWTIIIEQELSDRDVEGKFVNEKFDIFLKRSLLHENVIVNYDYSNKIIDIRSYKSSSSSKMYKIASNQAGPISNEEFDSLTNTSYKDIQSYHEVEKAIYSEYISDPNSLDPITDMTLADIGLINKTEKEIVTESDSLTNASISEIKRIGEWENQIYTKYINDPNSLDPITGMSFADIASIRQMENEYQSKNNNRNLDPL